MSKTLTYRDGLWIGTKKYMRFIPAPGRGVDATSGGYSESATGKNGGGYVSQSYGRHMRKQYTWPRSTPREVANFLQGLRDGIYGRGVIHFTDPTSYETNVLPPHWASPGLTLGFEAPPLVFRGNPDTFEFGMSDRANTPMEGAIYDNLPTAFQPEDACYVSIPPGMKLLLGSRYESSGFGRVWVYPVGRNMNLFPDARTQLPPGIDPMNPFRQLTTHEFSSADYGGVYIWLGRNAGTTLDSVSVLDMVGKLVPMEKQIDWQLQRIDEPWYGGEGHSGVKFDGQPTIEYDGKRNTQVSATFMEVGAWELASRL